MDTIPSLLLVWMMSSAALGVGSSTLAIASFLVALRDGNIDISERRMLGVVYYALRASMIMLGAILLWLSVMYPAIIISSHFLWVLLIALTLNSVFMTKHWISFKIGPALQAATWYTFGFMLTIEAFALLPLTWTVFLSLYVTDIVVALVVINVLLGRSKRKRDLKR